MTDAAINRVGIVLQELEDSYSQNLPCTKSIGSFACVCNKGYNASGMACNDVDECTAGLHDCHRHAQCHNVPGSFYCACKTGFADTSETGLPAGIMCSSESRVLLEQVSMVGQSLRMIVAWEDKTRDPKNNGTVLALFKHTRCAGNFREEHIGSSRMPDAGCRRGMRQVFWMHTKSVISDATGQGCYKPMARCADNTATCNPCLRPGNEHNFAASQTFSMMPVGYGNFTLMLWSFDIRELIAVSTFSIAPPIAEGTESFGGLEALPPRLITSSLGKSCGHTSGHSAYRVQLDGFVDYCVHGTARYGTEESRMHDDANFTAFGGLMDCIGRHPVCTDTNATCSATCEFDPEDIGYYMPRKEVVEEDEDAVLLKPSVCGDGRLTLGSVEQCDDRNRVSGDGCSADCQIEPGYACELIFCLNTKLGCYDSHCSWVPVCGDGHVDDGIGEECDDYNQNSLDGCGTDCLIEPGWTCEVTRGIPPKSRCVGKDEEVCGAAACAESIHHPHLCPTPCADGFGRCIWYRGQNFCRY